MMLKALFVLLLVTLADSIFHPLSSRDTLETCTYRTFGSTDLKIPICRTVFQYSRTKPPIETCKIGKLTPSAVDKLREAFGGVLQPEIQKATSRGNTPSHDGDMCCPTTRQLTKAPSKMMNSYGVLRDIVELAEHGLFQYYPAGTCLGSSELVNCQGTCVQEIGTVYLLAMRDDLPMGTSFEPFEIPSYCSCKNLGTQGSVTRGSLAPGVSKALVTTVNETNKTTTRNPTSVDFQRPSTLLPREIKQTSPQITTSNEIRSRLNKMKMLPSKMKYSRIVAASVLRPTRRPAVPRVISGGYTRATTVTPVPDSTNVSNSVIETIETNSQNITLSEIDFNNNITMSGTNSSLT